MKAQPHHNGHLVCAVDCETTGLVSGYHEMIQLCILPLDHNYDQLDVPPLYVNMRAEKLERVHPRA